MMNFLQEQERKRINRLVNTVPRGKEQFFIRLDPDCIPEAKWRVCSVEEYYNNLPSGKELLGSLIKVKVEITH